MESDTVSTGEDLQVQFLDERLSATKIQLRLDGQLAGEAVVLRPRSETYLLAMMTWCRVGDVTGADVAEQKQRVCDSLTREATDLARRNNASLIAIVGPPETLIELGFDQNGWMWMKEAG